MATDVIQHALGVDILNALLVECAIQGDDSGARRALAMGADPKARDAAGRTALTCALAGESWQAVGMLPEGSFMSEARLNVLRMIVSHADMSIYELNAPQESFNGVTALGMAAWLNLPSALEVLLRSSGGRLLVDAVDAHGATPLMYASRDGNLDVVQWLLAYSARADARDLHCRTAVQFAVGHLRVLWLCEESLRRRRFQDAEKRKLSPLPQPHADALANLILSSTSLSSREPCTPPSVDCFCRALLSKFTDSLISAVTSSDLPLLLSLLFPQRLSSIDPLLVNLPDSSGWSAIHYCVMAHDPSVEVLDALYRAGAELSLFTQKEDWTPLHCLARYAGAESAGVYRFVLHLVKDLKAPLAAKDGDEDTCLHVAAAHGESSEVLRALLECDATGDVRRMRNAKGLTALAVAKPRYKALFGADTERPTSSSSKRTVKAHTYRSSPLNTSALSLIPSEPLLGQLGADDDYERAEASTLAEGILDDLTYVSRAAREGCSRDKVDELLRVLDEAAQKNKKVFASYTTILDEVTKEIADVRKLYDRVQGLWVSVENKLTQKRRQDEVDPQDSWTHGERPRTLTADSADSEMTAVSRPSRDFSSRFSLALRSVTDVRSQAGSVIYKDSGVATSSELGDGTSAPPRKRLVQVPAWLDAWLTSTPESGRIRTRADSSPRHHPDGGTGFEYDDESPSIRRSRTNCSLKDCKSSVSGGEQASKTDAASASAVKFKAWLKKKIAPDKSTKLDIMVDLQGGDCPVGREARNPSRLGDVSLLEPSDRDGRKADWEGVRALRGYHGVLETARNDLRSIGDSLKAADQFITSVQRSIGQAERVATQAVQSRGDILDNLSKDIEMGSPVRSDFNFLLSDLGPSWSGQASHVSLASTLVEGEEEDTRLLRRMMTRKIEAKIDGAYDELDKSWTWLHLIGDVLAEVKRRT
ncbi:ankyrin [Gloeophyllum trabeum ATCC 11539]|uniref:Ankyrin n=1 Tax=Gloeophyllum trabeum (strain ATCC 11539 / FP-39264 / Madison 617) TaxID=670483 RepID=S7RIB2_GLOTA|nr:ankyrin [Gloeophyllum trabeum ATCC 11539]EPQ54025.1 ankyrin [Gloeophyllum trabeum ATCC 11539]